VVERFYGREASFPDRGEYLVGELAEFREARTPGSALPEGAHVTIRPLRVQEDRAVVAVTVATADTTTRWATCTRRRAARFRR
jgi:hypothetical protein